MLCALQNSAFYRSATEVDEPRRQPMQPSPSDSVRAGSKRDVSLIRNCRWAAWPVGWMAEVEAPGECEDRAKARPWTFAGSSAYCVITIDDVLVILTEVLLTNGIFSGYA